MNDELQHLYEADVWEHRQGYGFGSPEYRALRDRDRQRRARAEELIASHALTAPEDYFHAAPLFQHGGRVEDAWKAHVLARQSAELGCAQARWLAAAAYDRWLMYQGKPQKYGTQYVSDGKRQRLWDVDPATSDADRAAWDVPPLAEQLRKAEEATRNHPPLPIDVDDAPEWLRVALRRWEGEAQRAGDVHEAARPVDSP